MMGVVIAAVRKTFSVTYLGLCLRGGKNGFLGKKKGKKELM